MPKYVWEVLPENIMTTYYRLPLIQTVLKNAQQMFSIYPSIHCLPPTLYLRCRSSYKVVTMSWCHWWYAVVITSFFIAFSCVKVRVRSCTVGYADVWFSITWVCSYMVTSQFSTVYIVKSVQLHIFFCNCVSWRCKKIIPAAKPDVANLLFP